MRKLIPGRFLLVCAWPNWDGTFSVCLREYQTKRNRAGRLFRKHVRTIPVQGSFKTREWAVAMAQSLRQEMQLEALACKVLGMRMEEVRHA